jgi:LysM repeat protein
MANEGQEIFEYIIQPEDTIWELAEEFNTNEEDILAVNPDLDPNNLYVNQVINIPADEVTVEQFRQRRFRRFRRPFFRPRRFRRFRRPFYPY